jgi:hypothetical protein
MSKRNNVHPDHYKTDGRERPATIAAERMKRPASPVPAPSRARKTKGQTDRGFKKK